MDIGELENSIILTTIIIKFCKHLWRKRYLKKPVRLAWLLGITASKEMIFMGEPGVSVSTAVV